MKIFIGSSTEAHEKGLLLEIAKIVEDCKITPIRWNQSPSIFEAGKFTLENLEEMILRENIEGSIFIQVMIQFGTEVNRRENHEIM